MGPARLWRLWRLWLLGAVVLGPARARGDRHLGERPAEPGPAHHRVTPTITSFALRLYRRLAAGASGNVLFSPLGVSSALALLSLAAPAATSARILQGLGFNLTETPPAHVHRGFQSLLRTLDLPGPKLELKAGSALFLDKPLGPRRRFLEAARELYGALAFSANFTDSATTRRRINEFVRKQTYGRVARCLGALARDTLVVLSNFLFFKAKWKHPFHRYQTQKQASFLAGESTAPRAPMMHQKEMHRFVYDQELACTVLQLEYSGNARALLILPDPGRMEQVEAALQPETLLKWGRLLLPSLLDLHLPSFSISGTYDLEDILPHIGLRDVFRSEADLSGIAEQLNQTVSRVTHKATLHVSERDTQAAAASGIRAQSQAPPTTSAPPATPAPPAPFGRPFLVLLWEGATRNLLLVGKVVDPAAG